MNRRAQLGTAILASMGIAASVAANPAAARGLGEAAELENARANARAGGRVSDRDAELLQRYGCASGTDNPICTKSSTDIREDNSKRRTKQRED